MYTRQAQASVSTQTVPSVYTLLEGILDYIVTACLAPCMTRTRYLSLRSQDLLALFCYDFPMTAFRWTDMLDALCFLHLFQLLLNAIRRDADDLGKLFASSERMLSNFIKNHFLGTLVRFLGTFLGTASSFLGTFLGSSRIFFLVLFPFCAHNHISALQLSCGRIAPDILLSQ